MKKKPEEIKKKVATEQEIEEKQGRNKEGEVSLMVWGIPAKLRKDFRSRCVRRGLTMREGIVKLMTEFVEK